MSHTWSQDYQLRIKKKKKKILVQLSVKQNQPFLHCAVSDWRHTSMADSAPVHHSQYIFFQYQSLYKLDFQRIDKHLNKNQKKTSTGVYNNGFNIPDFPYDFYMN